MQHLSEDLYQKMTPIFCHILILIPKELLCKPYDYLSEKNVLILQLEINFKITNSCSDIISFPSFETVMERVVAIRGTPHFTRETRRYNARSSVN